MKRKSLKPCKQIHALMLTNNVDMNLWQLSSKLIGTYACCGDLISSKLLFQETPNPNVFAFNWMILTLTFSGFHEEAIGYFSLFQESRNSNSYPNKYTFSVVLKGCVGLLDVNLGKQVHGMIYKVGFEKDVSVCNGLIDMYGKCRRICDARGVFDRMAERDVASWTTMICRYADVGRIEESVFLFERMRLEGVKPNDFTWNTIIAGHARSGDCDGAFKFFSRMCREGLFPDLVIWNAMISGFVQSQRAVEALELFRDMLISRIKPNEVTVTGLLPVCGMVGSVGRGREIHGLIYRMGLDINVFLASALIDMYSKCGSVEEAQNVFNSIPNKNAASWNAMIGCYGKHGMVDCAIKFFDRMQDEDIQPNEVTLTAILCACSHGGLVEKGLEIFRSMDSYGVKPNKEHYSCLIDLLCRYGRMEEAYDIVKQIGVEVTDSTIGAFLNGCKIHERRDLAENISEHLRMELKKPGGFVTLSNIYASEGKWRGVQDVREVMKDKRVHKKPGFSSV
ncbi:UNVERIFIED_CONTAM: Pentatricopeptide repeat-containing protein, mitochondrial [Sesamum calycinum]|uniref:Pentatricopeptide repeat-containing protein, mitochondrial n=1 Tax=Sesamum calycinum TaxID=2727403 RepID=A0AAW2SA50_9LAMI